MKESKTLEWKETITNTFLKTVSAYANYGRGEIVFGIADNGAIVGLHDPQQACLDIENRINDSLDPIPQYSLSIDEKTNVVHLQVFEGLHKPYLYKAKAYRRNDTATVAVDRQDLTELILEGKNTSFEELPASNQDLTFSFLSKKLSDVLHTGEITTDLLKTLELYTDGQGVNKAGELLADRNDFQGTRIVRFGNSISIILDRETYEHVSVLKQYDAAMDAYRKYYQYEQIHGSSRDSVSLIPEAAFREAIANAIVHRKWNVDANISVSMFPEKIEIVSPGGLPNGISREDYLRGGISILRNRIIGNLFFRLHLIERFGTGIRRINDEYANSVIKPTFETTDSAIRITLPVLQKKNNLPPDYNKVYLQLKGKTMSSSAVAKATQFGKSKTLEILKKLAENGYIHISGSGRGTVYSADS